MSQPERVAAAFAEILGLPIGEITDSLGYRMCEQWDSLNHMKLVARLERDFGFEFEMDDIIAMDSVAKAKELVAKYTK